MTDITELAQSLKAAAIYAKEPATIALYSKGRVAADKFYALANPNNVIALVEALEKAQQMIDELEDRIALAAMDSESECLPLDYLQGHKDGLEWAAQLAEANHPETGDWLYDDPIELAKAIRKGPDMPPAQPAADSEPVAINDQANLDYLRSGADADVWPPEREEMGDVLLYRHAQPAPVVPDDVSIFEAAIEECKTCDSIDEHAWNHGVLAVIAKYESCRAAMLAAAPQSPGSEPATVPGKWIPVGERMPYVGVKVLCFPLKDEPIHAVFNGQLWLQDVSWSGSEEPIDNVIPVPVTHWMPLPAAPQEVKSES